MEKVKSVLLNSSFYTVIISFVFFAFAELTGLSEARIDLFHFFIIFVFGMLIATVNLFLSTFNFNILLKKIIHFIVLFTAFLIVFINFGNVSNFGVSTVFVTLVIFSLTYIIASVIAWLIKKALNKSKSTTKKSADTYKSRFQFLTLRAWRNWQTRQTQDLVDFRAGSSPVARTISVLSEPFTCYKFTVRIFYKKSKKTHNYKKHLAIIFYIQKSDINSRAPRFQQVARLSYCYQSCGLSLCL